MRFALETENEEANAKGKLKSKNLDILVCNALNTHGAGFQHDTNKVTIYKKNEYRKHISLKSKKDIADDIVEEVFNEMFK